MSTPDAVLDALDDLARSLTRLTAALRDERRSAVIEEQRPTLVVAPPRQVLPDVMTVGDVVSYSRRCRSIVLRALRDGSLASLPRLTEPGGHWRAYRTAVDAWLAGQEAPPVPTPRVARTAR